jgi:hypothetical protein
MIASVALLNHTVAMPRAASVRFPVFAVPACRSVETPAVIVIAEPLSLYIDTASPAANVLLGIVMPAETAITLPTSVVAAVPLVVERGILR